MPKKTPQLAGWTLAVYLVVKLLPKHFATADVYRWEAQLAAKFPDNQNIRAKIRQQLQILRDKKILKQGKVRGTWHKL